MIQILNLGKNILLLPKLVKTFRIIFYVNYSASVKKIKSIEEGRKRMAIDLLPDKIIKRLYDLEKMVQNYHGHWSGSYYKMQKISVAETIENEVVAPLSPTNWKLTFDGKTVSLYPSIGNWNFDCWIKKSKVEHTNSWTEKEIKLGREEANQAKGEFYSNGQRGSDY